jgi:hypothetical protein
MEKENKPISPVSVVFLRMLSSGAGDVRRNVSPLRLREWAGGSVAQWITRLSAPWFWPRGP